MYISQADLFWGMNKDLVKATMDRAEKLSMEEGKTLFDEGDGADHFFVLLKGRVELSYGEQARMVYMARHAGEIIGWSSLTGRTAYSASARCAEPTNLLKIESAGFLGMLEEDPASGALLFKRLAQMLGSRLLDLYPNMA